MNAREIVKALGGRNGMARCPAHRDRTPSLAVRDGRDGKFLVRCHAGCDQTTVIEAIKARGLWPERPDEPDTPRRRQAETETAAKPEPTVYWHTKDAPEQTQRACSIWRASMPLWDARAEPARRYLACRWIPWPYPETLAFNRLVHPETRETVPALIVARHCPVTRLVRGIQRIFLAEDGAKYPRGTVKMSLGSIAGGRAELIFAQPLVEFVIAEGVESALSAWRLFDLPAWATCGPFPPALPLPVSVRQVILVADHDRNGTSERCARVLARSIRDAGPRCRVVMPEKPGIDANDVLRGAA